MGGCFWIFSFYKVVIDLPIKLISGSSCEIKVRLKNCILSSCWGLEGRLASWCWFGGPLREQK